MAAAGRVWCGARERDGGRSMGWVSSVRPRTLQCRWTPWSLPAHVTAIWRAGACQHWIFPAARGPTMRMLCPPAAATSRARLTSLLALVTSAKSGKLSSTGRLRGRRGGAMAPPRQMGQQLPHMAHGVRPAAPGRRPPRPRWPRGHTAPSPRPSPRQGMGRAPRMGRTLAPRDSSPRKGGVRAHVPGLGSEAMRMPKRMGRSLDRAGLFPRSAGPGLTARRLTGKFQAAALDGGVAPAPAPSFDGGVGQAHHVETGGRPPREENLG
jgi:hypothetical protein